MNKNRFSTPIIIIGLILASFSSLQPISMVKADTSADPYTVLAPLPCIQGNGIDSCKTGKNGDLQNTVDFQTYIQYTFNLLIALSAVAAVAMIVWGGIEYMVSGSFQGKKDGLERVRNAIYGLLLVLCSFIILRTVDPRLVDIPTTLVPGINLKSDLTQDAATYLMTQLDKESKEYMLKREDIQASITQLGKDQAATKANLEEIKIKLSDPNLNPSSPEYKAIKAAEAMAENDLQDMEVSRINLLAKKSINQRLIDATALSKDGKTDTSTKLKNLNDDLSIINKTRDTATSVIDKNNNIDFTMVNDQGNYAEAVVNLTKVNLIVANAERSGVNTAMFENFDGSGEADRRRSTTDARNQMDSVIASAEHAVNDITDVNLKNDLQDKLNTAKAAYVKKFGK